MRSSSRNRLEDLLAQRIVVRDGALGTMIQQARLAPRDYAGERFADHCRDLAGKPDVVNLTEAEGGVGIHRAYADAGADILTTNTFTSTRIGQADYALG